MNVIVIVNDSMRADHVGYIGGKAKTPNIDKFAKEGTAFKTAYSESLPTLPTRTTWWTGKTNFPFRGWQKLEDWDYVLAEVLHTRGYTSALMTDTYHMHEPITNFGRGFDTVEFVRGNEYDKWIVDPKADCDTSKYYRFRGDFSDKVFKPMAEQYMRNISVRKGEEDYPSVQVIKEAMRWLDHVTKKQKDNLFLWVDCFDPHEPWDPPEPFWSMYGPKDYKGIHMIDPIPGPVKGYMSDSELERLKALYAGDVSFCDKWVGIFLEHVKKLGIFENSVIMHTSDHGEPFGDHGIIRKAAPWNYTELVHIPWVIRHPKLGHGKSIKSIVQTTDMMPTILDALNIPTTLNAVMTLPVKQGVSPLSAKNEIEMDGYSLLPVMEGKVEKARDFAIMGHWGRSWAIKNEEWSYHIYFEDKRNDEMCDMLKMEKKREPELFNLKEDWGEHKNVIDSNKEIAKQMELQLRRAVDNLK